MTSTRAERYREIEVVGSLYPSREFFLRWLEKEYVGSVPFVDRPIVPVADVLAGIERAKRDGKAILLVLDSLGGNNACALRVYSALRDFPGRVVVYVRQAVSAWPVIMQAADAIVLDPSAPVVFHGTHPTRSEPDTTSANDTWRAILAERCGASPLMLDVLFEGAEEYRPCSSAQALKWRFADVVGSLDFARELAAGAALPTSSRSEWLAGLSARSDQPTAAVSPVFVSEGAQPQWDSYDPEMRLHETAIANLSAKTLPGGANFYAVVNCGEGKWAAVGASVAAYSTDGGETWTAGTIPAGTYYGIAYDPATGAIVAVGASVCARSTNGGATFTAQTIPAGTYRAVVWSSSLSLFVAVGDSSACASSPTGVTWTGRTIAAGTYYGVAVDAGVGVLVAVGASGVIATSPNATTWTARTSGTTGTIYAVAYSPARGLLAVGDGARYSHDGGVTWTGVPTGDVPWGSNTKAYGVAWEGYLFVVVGGTPIPPAQPLIATSRDGQRWANRTIGSPGSAPYSAVAADIGRCVLVGGLLGTTCAASSWTAGAIPTW